MVDHKSSHARSVKMNQERELLILTGYRGIKEQLIRCWILFLLSSRNRRRGWLIGRIVIVKLILMLIVVTTAAELGKSKFTSSSTLGIYKKAAISTNGPECSEIGANIMRRGGSAVDAAIAALLCDGVSSLHSMGLGGGFLMTIYDAKKKEAIFLDARETAPAQASATMFDGDSEKARTGGLAVAVPGELLGYYEAHKRYGKLKWKELFDPAIELCEIGSIVNRYHEDCFKSQEKHIVKEPTLAEILINPATKKLYREGDKIKRPKLAQTLRKLANLGADRAIHEFYRGEMAKNMIREIHQNGGIITERDFSHYRVNVTKPLTAKIGKLTIHTAPPPGSGALLVFILNVLKDNVNTKHEYIMWQRIIETFKWAYAERTKLGDPAFDEENQLGEVLEKLTSKGYADRIRSLIKDDKTYTDFSHYGAKFASKTDHGTSHISVLAPDGSAVSVTSSLNQILGAKIRSKSTGVIFNDHMDDFSLPNVPNAFQLPPSPQNFIRPNKRPMSSMVPTIVLDNKNQVKLVIGASGGSKIISGVASTMLLHLIKGYSIKEAIDARRLHHQLFPMMIQNEKNFDKQILLYLKKIGHDDIVTYTGVGSVVTAVSIDGDRITANADYRRLGTTAGF